MKKFLLLLISGLLLVGCASLQRTNTLKTAPLEPDLEPLPVAADLRVSEQKATGEASGKVAEKALLEKEALAKALGQETPSVDKPDVLVGMNVFTEITNNSHLKLTITGYPAYYINFRTAKEEDFQRLSITKPDIKMPSLGVAQGQSEAQEAQPKRNNMDVYFAPKYQLPFTEASSALNIDMEGGWIWKNGNFFGLELNFSIDPSSGISSFIAGGGANIGKAFDISSFQLAAGATAGVWLFGNKERTLYEDTYCYYYNDYGNCIDWYTDSYSDSRFQTNVYLLAPFVRARWNGIELMYRLFPPIFKFKPLIIADDVRMQFMIGYNFSTSNRKR